MKVGSTRGGAAALPLADALLGGTAPDGGLYVPAEFPPRMGRGPRGGTLADSALAMLSPFFAEDRLSVALPVMVAEAFTFPAPLVPLRNRGDFVVELFHGPTAAFKDFGARFLAACMRRLDPRDDGTRTVLVATSGDTGGAVAALWARQLGAPIGDIVLATNANRTLPEFFEGGAYRGRPSVQTLANAMDVGDPSNFERLAWTYPDPALLRARIRARSVSDEHISRTIQQGERRHGRVFCPHTAAGVWVLEQIRVESGTRAGTWAVAATAHPAKFESIVEPLVGHPVEVPPALAELLGRPARSEPMAADPAALRRWLLDHAEG